MTKQPGGNPGQDSVVRRLFKTMVASVELVRDLEGKVSNERHLELRAAALAHMRAYAEISGLPAPESVL